MNDLKLYQAIEVLQRRPNVHIAINVIDTYTSMELADPSLQLTSDVYAIKANAKDEILVEVFENEMLSKAEAAIELGMSRAYVGELVETNKLQSAIKLNKVKIPWQSVLDYRNAEHPVGRKPKK